MDDSGLVDLSIARSGGETHEGSAEDSKAAESGGDQEGEAVALLAQTCVTPIWNALKKTPNSGRVDKPRIWELYILEAICWEMARPPSVGATERVLYIEPIAFVPYKSDGQRFGRCVCSFAVSVSVA